MEFCRSTLGVLILLIISTGSESVTTVVKVEVNGAAVLPCTARCSGVASWTPSHKSSDILAECDRTSCRSVKEGYQMIYNQSLQGDLSLTITGADFSKRGWYTCDCDGRDQCDVELQVEARKIAVQIQHGGSLVLELEVSDPVEVVYSRTAAADGSSDQICTVDGESLQCKPEYTNRTSLSSSAALELRVMKESDSGVYTVRDTKNKEDLHIYTVTVTDPPSPTWVIFLLVGVVVGGGVVLVCLAVGLKMLGLEVCKKGENMNPAQGENLDLEETLMSGRTYILKPNETIQELEGNSEERENIPLKPNEMKEYEDNKIQELQKQITIQKAEIQMQNHKIHEMERRAVAAVKRNTTAPPLSLNTEALLYLGINGKMGRNDEMKKISERSLINS